MKIIFKYDVKNSDFIYFGSKETFKNINSYILKNNLKLNLITIDCSSDIDIKNLKIQGIVIDDIENLSSSEIKNIKLFTKKGIPIFTFIIWCENFLEKLPIKLLNNDCFLRINQNRLASHKELKLKRIGDIFVSFILLIITSPIILFSAIAIYLEDKGPILYSQNRTGLSKKIIKIWKLRTMYVDSEINGYQWSKRNDKRITKVGNLLRITRFDELPQLISVLKGEMSLIGPRPERPEIDQTLTEKIPFYEYRYSVRPGLSGWAQVNYPYGASISDSREKLSYDIYYILNFSFLLDLIILFKTIKLVFNAKGAIPKN